MTPQQRVRVVYVVPDLALGGAERHAVTLMTGLDRRVFEPSVICLGQQGALFSGLVEAGISATALGYSRRGAARALVDLVRTLRQHRPDVMIVRGFNAELLGRLAAVIARVGHVVVWVHNCGDVAPRGAFRMVTDRLLDRVTDAYFGVAETQVPYLVGELGHDPAKVTVIRNGVDPAPYGSEPGRGERVRDELGIAREAIVVGIVAALRPEKDHETFLRAAALVAEGVADAHFLVVGSGPPERLTALEALAAELGVEKSVVFAGNRGDVADVLAAVDVFVLSSFTVECFPMALLEAMASGCPAVCTAVGGVPEMVVEGETGYLVPPRRPDVLAERLVDLLRSPSRRSAFGHAARARVEQSFTLSGSVRRTEQRLLEIAAVPGVGRPVRLAVVLDEAHVGGVELLLLQLFRAFDDQVVRPRLISLRDAGPLAAEFRAAGFEVEVLHRTGRLDRRTLPRLVASLRRRGDDAVLVTHHHRASLALGRIAGLLAGTRVSLVAVHDMDLATLGRRCLPAWTVATLRWTSALVLLTRGQGDYLHRQEGVGARPWSRTREVVIPNGIQLPAASTPEDRRRARGLLGVDDDEFVVGIVARLSPQKAHEVLLEAFHLLLIHQPLSRLIIVGGGARETELHGIAERLGIHDRVVFLGVRRDVPDLLPGFDVACLSSVHEGLPVTVLEAMGAGLPIVATDCGDLRSLVTEGVHGYLVQVGDHEGFAERLVRLARDPGSRAAMGRAARLEVETHHSLREMTVGYERLLVELSVDR